MTQDADNEEERSFDPRRAERTNLINRRIAAWFVESAVAAPFTVVLAAFANAVMPPEQVDGALEAPLVLLVITLTVYHILRDTIGGGTSLGKSALGLRVQMRGGGEAGIPEATLRTIPWLLLPMVVVEYAVAYLVDDRMRRLGDLLAGTEVVDASEGRLMKSSFTGQSALALGFFVASIVVTLYAMTLFA